MSAAHRVCLVTDELFPFTRGGIGRLLHNQIVEANERGGVELHLLLPAHVRLGTDEIRSYFHNRIHLHWASPVEGWEPICRDEGTYPPALALSSTSWHGTSLQLMLKLKSLEEEGLSFSTIEFPDYQGWAFCSLQEKKLGQAFRQTDIAVRLHTTAGIIRHFDQRQPSLESVARFELERKALHDADRVVAHLRPVAEFNQRFYGFEPSWAARVHIEFPAVTPGPAPAASGQRNQTDDLVFASKVEPIKRPDLFVRAAATLMRRRPSFTGRAVLAAHTPDADSFASLERMIPPDLRSRFLFVSGSAAEREAFLGGIVVVPSAYESLNLLAYEAAQLGARLVLNEQAPAFGQFTPFVDPGNAFKFDGTVEGLVQAMVRALEEPPPARVSWTVDHPYWESAAPFHEPTRPAGHRQTTPLVSVLITNYNLGRYLPDAIASAVASDHPALELIVIDDASTDSFDQTLIQKLQRDQASGTIPLKVAVNEVNRGLPASRNRALAMASGDYVLPLDADDLLSPTFISQAAAALESQAEFDVVIPSTGFFTSEEELLERRFVDYATFLGDVPTLGMLANRLGCATSLMRRRVVERFRYNERLSSYEDWDLYLRLAQAGHRFIVTNQLHFFYRRRKGSMIGGVTPQRHFALMAEIYDQLSHPPGPGQISALLALVAATTAEPTPVQEKPLRHFVLDALHRRFDRLGMGSGARLLLSYELADAVNRRVKTSPRMHGLLKRTTGRSSPR